MIAIGDHGREEPRPQAEVRNVNDSFAARTVQRDHSPLSSWASFRIPDGVF